jgi:type I restriction enzyme S subunit
MTNFGSICGNGQYGWTTRAADKGSVKFLRTTDITKSQINWDSVPYCQDDPPDIEKYRIQANDILISRAGSVGFSSLISHTPFPAVFASYLIRFIPSESLEPRYVAYFLRSSEYWQQISEASAGIALSNVNARKLSEITTPLAPLNEQKRIADKLDALLARVDAGRDRLNRVSLILKRFRQSVLAAATSGKLTENWRTEHINVDWNNEIEEELTEFGFADAHCFGDFRFPTSWNVARLGEIAEIVGGITKDSKKQDPTDEELPYLRVANVQRGFFDLTEIKTIRVPQRRIEELLLRRGDILFNEGGDIDKLGRGWVWDGEIERCTFQNHVFRVRLHNELFEPKFFSWYGNLRGAAYFLSVGKQTTNLASINKSLLSALPIVIPPAEEQNEIARRIEVLFAYADRIEACYQNALTRVDQLTPTLLSKAFCGELVPQDPGDEPASALLERIQAEKNRMESEQKNTRTVRRTIKKKSKAPVRQSLDDYVEAIRSAFKQLGDKADAHQLFDQAGCQAEEVVQFYEALRATPEVRIAFEKSRQERPPQKQNSITKDPENQTSENGHFRLIELWLEDFKNLTDYTVRFDSSHSIDIILGWNGTGKSNLFESLVIIFRDLHEWSKGSTWIKETMRGYRLRYEINEQIVDISWNPREMRSPLVKRSTLQKDNNERQKFAKISKTQLPLPRFVFGYYSGPTNRLADHFLPMNQAHYNSLRDAESDTPETLANLLAKRRFFCAENYHAKYVLLAFFHKEDPAINQFLEDRLRIVGFESALFVIRKPRWAKKGETAENFWGARGVMRRVMEQLRRFAIAPMVVEQNVREGYSLRSEEHYYFFLPDLQSLHAFAAEYQDARTFFLALESIDFSELIYDVKIQVRVQATKKEQVAITFHELSEGEQQLLMVLGLMRFTKSHQSLVLLDEPDTHLNPHWSVDYLKLLTRVMSESSDESEEQQTSQILMSTHDPLVIASLFKEQIHLLKRDWQTGACKWEQPTVNPRGLGFTGILTSEMFGMRSDLDEETLADLDTKVRLVAKEGSLTPEEAIELEEINKRLEDAGFQQAFSDPYYAAFIRAWSRRYSDLMAGTRFLSSEQQEEIDRISREVLEEAIAELQAEAVDALD